MQNSRIELHYIDIRNFALVVPHFMREKNLATSGQDVVKHLILHFHCQDIKDFVLILQQYMKKKRIASKNTLLKRHMRQTRDFIDKQRVKKSQLENNLAENQIDTGNVEEKNCSSNEMDRSIKIEPVESILVETCSSLD